MWGKDDGKYLGIVYTIRATSAEVCVLVRVIIAEIEHHGKSNFRRKRFIGLTLPNPCSSLKEARTGAHLVQEPGGRT